MRKQKNRVYSTIHTLIAAKSSEVIELYINENLITQKIGKKEKFLGELMNLLKILVIKIDFDTISKLLLKKYLENEKK